MRGLPVRRIASTALCASLVLGLAAPAAMAADGAAARERAAAASDAPVPGVAALRAQVKGLADLSTVLTPVTEPLNTVLKADDGRLTPGQATRSATPSSRPSQRSPPRPRPPPPPRPPRPPPPPRRSCRPRSPRAPPTAERRRPPTPCPTRSPRCRRPSTTAHGGDLRRRPGRAGGHRRRGRSARPARRDAGGLGLSLPAAQPAGRGGGGSGGALLPPRHRLRPLAPSCTPAFPPPGCRFLCGPGFRTRRPR